MERTISDEEKIRRAIEISQRRNNSNYTITSSIARVNVNEKRDYKLFKKMILQIIICLLIYTIFHLISTTNYVFSADVIKNTNEILNYDINFSEMYKNVMLFVNSQINTNKNTEGNNINLENNPIQNNAIENSQTIENNSANLENEVDENKNNDSKSEENKSVEEINGVEKGEETKKQETAKTQMEQDAEAALNVCKFQKPLNGKITSEFGTREATINGMTTDHKGIDIGANLGTSIKAAIEGTVKVAEQNSEYGKFIKIVNGDVMTVYAHCKTLKVKVGDKIKIGQTIATVGSTGNSTGPHLHFEIRYKNRYINPKYIINF